MHGKLLSCCRQTSVSYICRVSIYVHACMHTVLTASLLEKSGGDCWHGHRHIEEKEKKSEKRPNSVDNLKHENKSQKHSIRRNRAEGTGWDRQPDGYYWCATADFLHHHPPTTTRFSGPRCAARNSRIAEADEGEKGCKRTNERRYRCVTAKSRPSMKLAAAGVGDVTDAQLT